jgi:hypothetical protein
LDTVKRRLAVTERKRYLKEIYDKSPDGIKALEEYKKNPVQRQRGEIPDYAYEDPVKCILTEFDKSVELEVFDKMIDSRKKDIELIKKDAANLEEKVASQQKEFDDLSERIKKYNTQFKQLKSDYNKHFKAVEPSPLEMDMEAYELSDPEYDRVVQATKQEVGIEKTREEYVEERRQIVQDFWTNTWYIILIITFNVLINLTMTILYVLHLRQPGLNSTKMATRLLTTAPSRNMPLKSMRRVSLRKPSTNAVLYLLMIHSSGGRDILTITTKKFVRLLMISMPRNPM